MLSRFVWLFVVSSACSAPDPGPGGREDGSATVDHPRPGPGHRPDDPPRSGGPPTWHQDVAPLLADRCGACHVAGGVAPFSVEAYADAMPWGPAMVDAIESGRMPPFFASDDAECEERLGLLDDVRLADDERALVRDWVEAGMPEGDPAAAAPVTLRRAQDLEPYDVELEMEEEFVVDGTEDVYACFRIPMPNEEDVWLTGVQVVPGAELVVHHVLVWNDPYDRSDERDGSDGHYECSGSPDVFPTELVAAWSPGAQPVKAPPDAGTLVHPGASLVLNVHYHPTGTSAEVDRTRVRLQWRTTPPARHTTWYLVDLPFGATIQPGPGDADGPEFRIPPDVAGHVETEELWIPPIPLFPDLEVFAVAPHMHFLGTDQLVTLDHAEGPDECLVHTPGYRFDFQQGYFYDPATGELPVVGAGDRIRVRCTYDNSASNPFLPLHLAASGEDAPHDVLWGETTGDEMCMVMVGLITPPVDWMQLFEWL